MQPPPLVEHRKGRLLENCTPGCLHCKSRILRFNMENTFCFVNGFKPNRATKKSIRSHAMKGKNTGRTLHRPSKLKPPTRSRQLYHPTSTNETRSSISEDDATCKRLAAPPRPCNVFLTCSFPVEFTAPSLRIINQFFVCVAEKMYPSQLGLSPDEAKYMWLRVMFTDEAASRCSIALMDACNAFFFGNSPDSPKGLQYLSEALGLINKRLQGKDALSDSTLSLIVSLILQEEMRQNQSSAEVHYGGLKKMVEIRGGLNQLEGNRPLLLKICKMDVSHALQHGGPILFFRDRLPPYQTAICHKLSTVSDPHGDLDPDLRKILVDVQDFATRINQRPEFPVYDILTFQETLISICSRLARFQPLNAPQHSSQLENAYHIGLTIFMMTMFLQCDGRRIWHYPLVSRRFKQVLSCIDAEEHTGWDDIHLWLMFTGGIWVLADADGYWLLPKLGALIRKLGIRSFDDVSNRMRNFPWISGFHDGHGQSIMNMVQQDTCISQIG